MYNGPIHWRSQSPPCRHYSLTFFKYIFSNLPSLLWTLTLLAYERIVHAVLSVVYSMFTVFPKKYVKALYRNLRDSPCKEKIRMKFIHQLPREATSKSEFKSCHLFTLLQLGIGSRFQKGSGGNISFRVHNTSFPHS
jgi:hypothetical protein